MAGPLHRLPAIGRAVAGRGGPLSIGKEKRLGACREGSDPKFPSIPDRLLDALWRFSTVLVLLLRFFPAAERRKNVATAEGRGFGGETHEPAKRKRDSAKPQETSGETNLSPLPRLMLP